MATSKKESSIKNVTYFVTYILIVWGLYRLLFKLPEEIEEILIKPIVWLLPVYFLVKKEKGSLSSLGITTKKLFPAIYFALGLGAIFAIEGLIVNFVKYGGFNFGANIGDKLLLYSLVISFATAISEEVSFRGYVFNRLWGYFGNEWVANLTTSFLWGLVHLPVAIFVWNLTLPATLSYLLLTTIFGIGSAFIFARTGNVFSSILLHVLWEYPIILFR